MPILNLLVKVDKILVVVIPFVAKNYRFHNSINKNMVKAFNNLSTDLQEQAIQIMKNHNSSTNIVGCFGLWIVNDQGDVVNLTPDANHYFLYSERIRSWDKEEMYNHISQKVWFKCRQPMMGIEFKEAIDYALSIKRHGD